MRTLVKCALVVILTAVLLPLAVGTVAGLVFGVGTSTVTLGRVAIGGAMLAALACLFWVFAAAARNPGVVETQHRPPSPGTSVPPGPFMGGDQP